MKNPRESVSEFELSNSKGCRVRFLSLGGIITSIEVPDRSGRIANVVLGYEDIGNYLDDKAYHGAIVGRYANRIANGRFVLDGSEYTLPKNNGRNTLHGGIRGFNAAVWSVELVQDHTASRAILRHASEDGDQGFPGRLDATVTYTLTSDNWFRVEFRATTTKPTHVNLAQHAYFNLSGDPHTDILQHELMVRANHFTVVNDEMIPTGEQQSVSGTPFDFRKATPIGSRIDDRDEQLETGNGFDHNFVLDRNNDDLLIHAATLRDPSSGRAMEVHTTEPGVQVYTGNHLERHPKRSGIALETQHYPDSPNHPEFPSTVLRPGEEYNSQTEFRFGIS